MGFLSAMTIVATRGSLSQFRSGVNQFDRVAPEDAQVVTKARVLP